ncbi:MAG: LPD38 domain-containing protein [Eubacteriales bacterium]|jgi:hypothetical protein
MPFDFTEVKKTGQEKKQFDFTGVQQAGGKAVQKQNIDALANKLFVDEPVSKPVQQSAGSKLKNALANIGYAIQGEGYDEAALKKAQPVNVGKELLNTVNMLGEGAFGWVPEKAREAFAMTKGIPPERLKAYTEKKTPKTLSEKVAYGAGEILPIIAGYAGIGNPVTQAAMKALTKTAPKAAAGITGKIIKHALPGAITGAVYEGGKAAADERAAGEVAKQAGIGAGAFAAGDVAGRAVIKAAVPILKKILSRSIKPEVHIPEAVEPVKSEVSAEIKKARLLGTKPLQLPEWASESGPIRAKDTTRAAIPATAEEAAQMATAKKYGFSYPMSTQDKVAAEFYDTIASLKKTVSEKYVPPAESKREMVNFVHEGFGGKISKNEIRKMSYDELLDMSGQIAKERPNLWEVAKEEAAKRGVDLEDLYKTATDPEHARMKDVVGLGNEPVKEYPTAEAAPARPETELNVARNLLKDMQNPVRAAKIFKTYPELKAEFPGLIKKINKIPPLARELESAGISKMQGQAPETQAMRKPPEQPGKVIAITGNEFGENLTNKELRTRASDYAISNFKDKVIRNIDTGHDIRIPVSGIRHVISYSGDARKAKLLTALPDILEHSKYIGTEEPYKIDQNIKNIHRFQTTARIGNENVLVNSIIRETNEGKLFYDYRLSNIEKIEPVGTPGSINQKGLKPSSATDSDNIIQEGAGNVKGEKIDAMTSAPTPDKNTYVINRIDKEPFVVKRGDTVEVHLNKTVKEGRVTGISHAKKQIRVNGIWYDHGFVYPAAPKPAAVTKGKAPLSKVVEWGDTPSLAKEDVQAMAQFHINPRPSGPPTAETIKRKQIINFLDKKFAPIRVGRYHVRNALGIFKIKSEVVRTKVANDIPVIAHEVGHFLDKRLGLANPAHDRELLALGQGTSAKGYTPDMIRKEGVAEFMRLYLTDTAAARSSAPGYYAAFEKQVSAHPEIMDALNQAQQDIHIWYNQSAKAQILGSMSIGEKKKRKVTLDNLYTWAVDEIHPLKRFVEEVGIKGLPVEKDPYKLAWLARGWTGKAETMLHRGILDSKGKKIGMSLDEVLKPVEDNLDDFRAYIVAKHSLEITAQGKNTGITDTAAQTVVNDEAYRFQPVLDNLVKYQDAVLKKLVDAGMISSESMARMREMYPNYVPFYREFDTLNAAGEYLAKGGFANLSNPVKKMKGSTRDITDPIESIIKNTYLYTNIAERNKVGRAIAELADAKEGLGRLVEKVEGGRSGKENVLNVFRDGEVEHYQLDPDLYRATLALDRESANIIVKLLSYPASWLRAGATLSPDFILRNPVRDQFSAFVNSKYGFIPGLDLARGLSHAFKKDDLYWQWMNSGGAHSTLVALDRDYLQKSLREMLKPDKSMSRKVIDIVNPLNWMEMLRALSELGEQGTRIGEFAKGLRSGASPLDAALASRDVTLDFSRVGTHMKQYNRITAFSNATIQGTDKMVRQFKENPKGSILRTVLSITLPSVLLYLHNHDNPVYQSRPQWEKDRYWIIPTGRTKDSKIFRIPKPFELGILFGTFYERMMAWMIDKDPEAFKDYGALVLQSLVPGYILTGLIPIIEAITNYSFFTGRPIVPQREDRLELNEQYGPRTTETAKFLAKGGKYVPYLRGGLGSPRKVDNLIRGYTGGLGMYTIQGAEALGDVTGAMKRTPRPTLDTAEYPVLKAFMAKPFASNQETQDFYEELDSLEKQYATAKQKKERPPAGFSMGRLRMLRSVNERFQDMRANERAIEASKTMSPDMKKKRLDDIDMRMLNLIRHVQGKEAVR